MKLLLCLPLLALAHSFDARELIGEFTAVDRIESLGLPTPQARLPLPQLLDRYLMTKAYFKTPKGNVVHASGGRSDGQFYLALAPEKGKVVLVDAVAALMSKQRVEVGGESILIDVDVNLLHQRMSKVQFFGEEGKKPLLKELLVEDIVSAAYEAGADLTIGGKPFKFTYGHKVVKTRSGLAFSAERFLSFLHREGNKISAFTLAYDKLAEGPLKLDVEADVLELRLDGDALIVTSAS